MKSSRLWAALPNRARVRLGPRGTEFACVKGPAIVVRDAHSGWEHELVGKSAGPFSNLTFSPDGQHIGYRVGQSIWIAGIGGETLAYNPVWSPDGACRQRVAARSDQAGYRAPTAVVTRRDKVRALGNAAWLALFAISPETGVERLRTDLGPFPGAFAFGAATGVSPVRGLSLSSD